MATHVDIIVPAYNEEPTVRDVLGKLYGYVDELVVVDDGSTDATRDEIERFVEGRDGVRMLVHEVNQGMSEAYYLAFGDLRRRLEAGELSPDDFVYTVDAGVTGAPGHNAAHAILADRPFIRKILRS